MKIYLKGTKVITTRSRHDKATVLPNHLKWQKKHNYIIFNTLNMHTFGEFLTIRQLGFTGCKALLDRMDGQGMEERGCQYLQILFF